MRRVHTDVVTAVVWWESPRCLTRQRCVGEMQYSIVPGRPNSRDGKGIGNGDQNLVSD